MTDVKLVGGFIIGYVVTGRIEQGLVKVGDALEIVGQVSCSIQSLDDFVDIVPNSISCV